MNDHPPTHSPPPTHQTGDRTPLKGSARAIVAVGLIVVIGTVSSFVAVPRIEDFFNTAGTKVEKTDPDKDTVAFGVEGNSGRFSVVMSGIECTGTLTDAELNPDWDFTAKTEEYIDAEAPDGKQFCVVTSRWTNSSKEPDLIWAGADKLVTTDGTVYAATGDDFHYSRRLDQQAGRTSNTLNPGDEAEVRTVFTLPADVEVTHAVTDSAGFKQPAVWFDLA